MVSKRLSRVLLAATALTFAAVDPAHAGPLMAALPIIGGLLKGASLGAVLLNAVVGVGLSLASGLIQRAMAKKPEPRGIVMQVEMGDDLPVSAILGRSATAGKRKYIGVWGEEHKTPNAYVTDVIEIGNLPSFAGPLGLTSVWLGDQQVAVLWDEPHPDGRGYPVAQYRDEGGTDHLWLKYLDGSQVAADPFLVGKFGADPDRPWAETMIGRGCQAVIMTARFNQELFSGGLPQGIYEPHPLKLYDPRKDSTNGGSGAHRWGNPATYEPTHNPLVMAYNVIRGLYYGAEWFYGGQNLAAHRLPVSSWIPAMNECDRAVAEGGGGTRPQFRAGIEIRGDIEPLELLEDLQIAANARIAEVGGVFKVQVGAPGAAVYSFSDDDIVITEGQSFEPFPSLDATYNAIEGAWPSPAERWTMKDAPPRYNAGMEADDGDRRLPTSVQYRAVPYGEQVQQLMRAAIEEARRWRLHHIVLPPDAWPLEPNDVVSWSSERNGYVNKKFLVVEVSGEASFCQSVALRELDPTDYDWSSGFVMPTAEGWIGPLVPPVQAMTGWTVEPAYVTDAAGNPRRPSIRVTCAPDMDDVKRVWVQVRLKATGAVVFDSDGTPYGAPHSWVLAGNFLGLTEYEARGRYVPYSRRRTAWSAWMAVTTPDVRISWADLHAEIRAALQELEDWIDDDTIDQLIQQAADLAEALAQEAIARAEADAAEALARAQALADEASARAGQISAEQVARAQAIADEAAARGLAIADEASARAGQIAAEQAARITAAIAASDRFRTLVDEVTALRDRAMEADFGDWQAREEIRRSLSVAIETAAASFDERITVAASDIAAVAQRATALEASASSLGASIMTVDQARVEGDEALATQIAYLSAGNLNQFDQAAGCEWYFDEGAEGWTGNGAPSAAGGWLRPANHASAPYVLSPAALSVPGGRYSQVRARIRRTGTPAWRGFLWWTTNAAGSWDAARRIAIPEPTYDGEGFALLTFNPGWTGTITRIRLELTEAQAAPDAIEIDWVAIGRPSPGASAAALAAEREARIDADGAQASDIVALQAAATSAASGLSGLAAGVSALEAGVSTLGDAVTATGEALDALSLEVDGKAGLDVVNAMSAEIQATGDGLVQQGGVLTAIRATLLPSAMEMVDQDFANFLGLGQQAAASAEASTALDSRIDLSNVSIDVLSEAVTRVEATLPGLATGSALTALSSRVTAVESRVDVTAGAITAIEAALPGKASVESVDTLSGRVTRTEGDLAVQADAVTSIRATLLPSAMEMVDQDFANFLGLGQQAAASADAASMLDSRIDLSNASIDVLSEAVTRVEATLPGLATASVVETLTTRIMASEGAITTQADAITAIETELPGKASVAALNSLTGRVTTAEGTLTAHGSAITAINNELPGKATTAALTALSGTVTAQGTDISTLSDAVTSINAALPGKASVAALNSLTGRVTTAEGTLTAHGSAITAINNELPGKATTAALTSLSNTVTAHGNNISALSSSVTSINAALPGKASVSALNALSSTVSTINGQVSAQATAIAGVQADVDGATASALMRAQVVAGPAGYTRIGWQARTVTGTGYRTGSIYLDVPESTSQPVQVIVQADRFAVISGATKRVPFSISGDVCYLEEVNIQKAEIGNLQVGTSNIVQGAVTNHTGKALGQVGLQLLNAIDAMTLTVNHGTGSPTVYVFFSCTITINGALPTGGLSRVECVISSDADGAAATFPVVFTAAHQLSHFFPYVPQPGRATTTFTIHLALADGPGSGNPPALVNNRIIQALTCRR